MHALNAAAVLSAGLICIRLRPGFGAPINPLLLAVSALPSLAMFVLSVVVDELTIWFQLVFLAWLSVAVGFLRPPWRRWGIGLVLAGVVGYIVAGFGEHYVELFIFLAITPFMIVSSVWMWDLYLRTAQASGLAAQLASTSERLRIAADLHDIQGHNLQVIALEAELADRLLQRDPAAAQQHIKRVRELIRSAQTETSTLVRGLRETDLLTELANVQDVLAAAGMDVKVIGEPLLPSAEAEQLFSMLLREASTNILRHSDAHHVSLRWLLDSSAIQLQIGNDGVGRDGQDDVGAGSGLATLRRRFEQAHRSLTFQHSGHEFVVQARLPLDPKWS
ncbi:sensor histidine kinase [Micrococcoides hystricis]|uniref:Sensor histidine kinase n=1 Tax=Micrococcoides hystricis TaxID=1572761 RepID=A0ABV6PD13_9MICC